MATRHLWKVWKVSEALLRRARTYLSAPSTGTKSEFDRLDQAFTDYLENNEHELALDMLEEMGMICLPRGGFWRDMERAALNMELEERVPAFRSEFDNALDRAMSRTKSGDAS